MKAHTTKIYNWALQKAESEKAPFWMGLLFFLEIVLFLPLDAVLMFFCLQNRSKIILYVFLATVFSTISGLMGYLAGHFLWDLIGPYVVPHLISAASFAKAAAHLQQYEHGAIFLGALLPFPLKILSLSAGVFELGVVPFLAYFLMARFIRFLLIGGAMMIWGEKVKIFVDKHFHRVLVLLGAKIAMAFSFFWVLVK